MAAEPVLAVFGASGQLGRALTDAPLPPGWRRRMLARPEADVTDREKVAAALDGIPAGVVVNAAAYTAVDRAEDEPEAAFAVNRDGAGIVAGEAARRGLAIVHLSTDYVFDGTGSRPYTEEDAPAPLSVYGASKLAGEAAVLANPRSCVLRTSWLFGGSGRNFARTILGLARQREVLRVVDDQTGCPTAAGDLARAIAALAPRLLEGEGFGLFHCAGDEAATWHGLAAALLAEAAARGIPVARLEPIPTSAYPLPARRPAYSVLSCAKLAAVHGFAPLSWRAALPRIVTEILSSDPGP